ncbi:hypothetical protein [Streptomyces venezuelae]|uniref:hypothetical protein n=1 Tax=Streptomyces venezuelae TaxID=54571 RepID=UPI00278BBF2E|nr:hypothetical protein [Streptomyces venezuelae]
MSCPASVRRRPRARRSSVADQLATPESRLNRGQEEKTAVRRIARGRGRLSSRVASARQAAL